MTNYSGFDPFARSMRRRSQSTPPFASTFDHWDALSRIDLCSRRSSGGVGGRPIGFLGCSMGQIVGDFS